nr:TRAP transporter large permease subunit [Quisquiliibacterium transsilvanicum]
MIWTARDAAANGWEYSATSVAPGWAAWSAVALWALVLEALRRAGGWVLLAIMAVFSMFPLFSGVMPAPLTAPSVSLLDAASFHLFSRESVLGIPMRAFAELVIGFLVFGTALQYTGAGTFFISFAFALCGQYRGGAAKVAIFSSGLLGSMSGSVISNVLTTGAMTIPAMKRSGMKASTAGAVEACASTGAVLAPPVMGATAFVMAEFLNIPYSDVALAAAVPALLYYFALFMQIDCNAGRKAGARGAGRRRTALHRAGGRADAAVPAADDHGGACAVGSRAARGDGICPACALIPENNRDSSRASNEETR